MNFSLPQMIATIQEDFNKQLDDLELRLINLADNSQNYEKMSSRNQDADSKSATPSAAQTARSEYAAADEEEDSPLTIDRIIFLVRKKLAKKASAKRLIEKANSMYVDLNFQKTSTQLTTQLYQKIQQEESAVDEEINRISDKVDKLKDKMTTEFAEIRRMIDEIARLKMEKQAQRHVYLHARGYRGRGKRNSANIPLLKRENGNNQPQKKVEQLPVHPTPIVDSNDPNFSYVISKEPIPPLYPSQFIITTQTTGRLSNAIHFDPVPK